jgi:ABC-type multidrug transport system permease subunit
VASSLLIPIPIFALLSFRNGWHESVEYNFERWFTLQLSTNEILAVIFSYLIFSVLFYWITMSWTNYLYGKHVTELEKIVSDLEEEE